MAQAVFYSLVSVTYTFGMTPSIELNIDQHWAYTCDSWSIVIDEQTNLKMTAPAAPTGCWWAGTAPFCNGYCGNAGNVITCLHDGCGDGKCCWQGDKALCCANYCRRMSTYIESHEKGTHPYWWLIWSDLQWTTTGDDEYDDYCPEGTIIVCPPTAKTNEECTCVKHWRIDTCLKGAWGVFEIVLQASRDPFETRNVLNLISSRK